MRGFLLTLRRTFGWSNSRQSWLERVAGLVWLTLLLLALLVGGRLGPGQRLLLASLLLLSLVMLLRRGWVKLLGPVFFYDAVRSARRGRYTLVRVTYASLILALLCWTYFIWQLRSIDGAIPVSDLASFAESFFYVFLAVQALVVILLTPAFVAGAIAEEKERQTLDHLLATDLRNREIVLGKLVSRLGNLALLVLAGLPILSLMEMLGGVEPSLVLAAFAITGVTLIALAALSLLCSVHAQRAREAILLTYLLVVSYQGAPLGLHAFVHFTEMQNVAVVPDSVVSWFTSDANATGAVDSFTFGDLAEQMNAGNLPMFCYRLGRDLQGGTPLADTLPGLLREYAAVNLGLAAVCIVWAIVVIRRVALRQRQAEAIPLRGITVVRRPAVGRFPLLWKEAIAESGFRAQRARRVITYITFVAVAVPTGAILVDYFSSGAISELEFVSNWVLVLTVGIPMLSLLGVAVRASASVSGERDRQTIDPLLTLPVSSEAILFSKWLGCLLGLRWTVLMTLAAAAICALIAEKGSLTVVPLLLIAWPIYAGTVAMIGIAYSASCRTTLRATLATLLTTLALAIGHWALWLVYVPFLLISDEMSRAGEPLLYTHVGLTPPLVLAKFIVPLGGASDAYPDEHDAKLSPFTIFGLAVWVATMAVAWFIAARQFRALANRDVKAPPGPPPAGESPRPVVPRPRWRMRVAIGAAVALPILAVMGAYVYVGYESDRRLQRVTADLDTEEPGWRLYDLEGARKQLPVEANSAEKIRTVRKLMPAIWPGRRSAASPASTILERLMPMPPDQKLSESEQADLQELLDGVAPPARVGALELADMPEGRYPVQWAPIVVWTILNDQQESRTVANLLRADSALKAQTGDADGSLVAVRALVNIARAIGDEPILISQYIRLAERKMAIDAAERALAQGEPGETELALLQAALELEEREPILLRGYISERAFYHEMMQQIRTGDLKTSTFVGGTAAEDLAMAASAKTAHPWGLRHLNRLVELARKPLHEQGNEAAQIDAQAGKGPWLFQRVTPSAGAFGGNYRRNQAWIRAAIAAIAAERFRHARDRWPTDLKELVPNYLTAIPLDPIDGEPLRFRRLGDGVVIYSIGADNVDDSGNLERKTMDVPGTDLGFRLWDVASRKFRRLP